MIAPGTLSFACAGLKPNVATKTAQQIDAWVTQALLDLTAGNRLKAILNEVASSIPDVDFVYLRLTSENEIGGTKRLFIHMEEAVLA